jgi:glycosyltransferase involved in cell wall biosynthesis
MDRFRDAPFLANSQFTADKYRQAYGIEPVVINPLFQPARYEVHSSRERVLFINPHPVKGVDIALDLAAACPDIPFDFVESWTLSDDQRSMLRERAGRLGNVTLHPRTDDMRIHYGRAKVVLAPSRWEETWGRIASEAHYSGIPVLATGIGGLAEAVGPGGVLLAPSAPPRDWISALRSLWDDGPFYSSLCEAAFRYARRPQIERELQINRLEEVLQDAVRLRERSAGNGWRNAVRLL